jgi:hypothetical protein
MVGTSSVSEQLLATLKGLRTIELAYSYLLDLNLSVWKYIRGNSLCAAQCLARRDDHEW